MAWTAISDFNFSGQNVCLRATYWLMQNFVAISGNKRLKNLRKISVAPKITKKKTTKKDRRRRKLVANLHSPPIWSIVSIQIIGEICEIATDLMDFEFSKSANWQRAH